MPMIQKWVKLQINRHVGQECKVRHHLPPLVKMPFTWCLWVGSDKPLNSTFILISDTHFKIFMTVSPVAIILSFRITCCWAKKKKSNCQNTLNGRCESLFCRPCDSNHILQQILTTETLEQANPNCLSKWCR